MSRRAPARLSAMIVSASFACLAAPLAAAQHDNGYTNLQVLDPDITRNELGMAMLQNTLGLGLPRRQREGCLFCHVGDMDKPVDEWDFPSDEKETKLKARAMMAMIRDINANHLSQLDNRLDESFTVSCITCHSGRTDPRPLPDVLRESYAADGISATIGKYHELRDRYFGAGAYDFRPRVLIRLADGLAKQGAWDDSLALAKVNEEAHPGETSTASARMSLQVARHIDERSVAAGLEYFDRERGKEAAGVVDHSILDGLGWGIYRQDRIAEALQIFRRNLQLYPAEYIPNESLGDALWFADDKAGGIAIFESWVERNPDNDMGRRRLLNMREEFQ